MLGHGLHIFAKTILIQGLPKLGATQGCVGQDFPVLKCIRDVATHSALDCQPWRALTHLINRFMDKADGS